MVAHIPRPFKNTGIMFLRKTANLMNYLDYTKHIKVPLDDPRIKKEYPFDDETYIRTISDHLRYAFMNPALVEVGAFVNNNAIHNDALIVHFNNTVGRDKFRSMKEVGMMFCGL